MNREDVYDNQISPLMTEIIRICKEHDIPMVASFQYNDDRPDGEAMLCTTVILNQKDAATPALHDAAAALRRDRSVMTLTARDGEGNVTRMEAIVT